MTIYDGNAILHLVNKNKNKRRGLKWYLQNTILHIGIGERRCIMMTKNISRSLLSVIIIAMIMSKTLSTFAANVEQEDTEYCDMVVLDSTLEDVLSTADTVQYHLQDSSLCDPYITTSTLVEEVVYDGVTYRTYENTLIALSTLPGSYSASGQKYGIVAANTVSITWSSTNFQTVENLKVKFNSMSAKCTEISGVSTRVTKMEYSASLQPPYGSYDYLATNSVNYPTPGVAYGKTLNSGYYNFGSQTLVAMIKVYYANGDISEYSGSPSIMH